MSSLFSSRVPFAPFSSIRFAADDGANGGGSASGETKTSADISTLPKAKARVEALEAEVTSLTNARDQALSAQKEAEKARDQATEVARTTGLERDQAKTDLTAAQGQITSLTGERDKAKTDLTAANTNVSRLETLCGVKGIDPKQLPNAAGDENASSGAALYAQYEALSGGEKTAFLRKHSAELTNYANSLSRKTR